jgi:hypothetical protein
MRSPGRLCRNGRGRTRRTRSRTMFRIAPNEPRDIAFVDDLLDDRSFDGSNEST